MRFGAAFVFAITLLPAVAGLAETEPRDAMAVAIFSSEDLGVIVTWSPAPNAISYAVYRGASLDDLVLLGETPATFWHDEDPLPGESWYVILSQAAASDPPSPADFGSFQGSCVNRNGTTGVTVTASHCVPTEPA